MSEGDDDAAGEVADDEPDGDADGVADVGEADGDADAESDGDALTDGATDVADGEGSADPDGLADAVGAVSGAGWVLLPVTSAVGTGSTVPAGVDGSSVRIGMAGAVPCLVGVVA